MQTVYETIFPDGDQFVYFIHNDTCYKFADGEIIPATMNFDQAFFNAAVAIKCMKERPATLEEDMLINAELEYF